MQSPLGSGRRAARCANLPPFSCDILICHEVFARPSALRRSGLRILSRNTRKSFVSRARAAPEVDSFLLGYLREASNIVRPMHRLSQRKDPDDDPDTRMWRCNRCGFPRHLQQRKQTSILKAREFLEQPPVSGGSLDRLNPAGQKLYRNCR